MHHNAVLVPGAHGADDVIVAQFQDVTAWQTFTGKTG